MRSFPEVSGAEKCSVPLTLFQLSPVIPAFSRHTFLPPLVIPAQAGILTRDAIYKGHAVAVNYAGKSFKVRIICCLYVLQLLMWIRVMCGARRPHPD